MSSEFSVWLDQEFRSIVKGIAGGVDVLRYWDIGPWGQQSLFAALAVITRGENGRGLGLVASCVEQAAKMIWNDARCDFPKPSRSWYIEVVEGNVYPRILNMAESRSMRPDAREVSLYLIIVGFEYLRSNLRYLVPPDGREWIAVSRHLYIARVPPERSTRLLVGRDLRRVALLCRGEVVAPCDLGVLVGEAERWTEHSRKYGYRWDGLVSSWMGPPMVWASEALRSRFDAYAVLLAASMGIVCGPFPFLWWVSGIEGRMRDTSWPEVRLRAEQILASRGIEHALEFLFREASLFDLAR